MRIPKITTLAAVLTTFVLFSCQSEYFPAPPKPKTAQQTQNLEAAYTSTAPTGVTASIWKNLDYVKVPLSNISTNKLYGDGYLNMTGTYNGLSSFNLGKTTQVTMKAAYDDSKLYILMEWDDAHINLSTGDLVYDNPSDPLKSESATGWTSQGNADQIALSFDINGAAGKNGNFNTVGCNASCHGTEKLNSGTVDYWNWNLALSEPNGIAFDRNDDASKGFGFDAGNPGIIRNTAGTGGRQAPQFVWNGTEQKVTRGGKETTLDPAYFLLEANKTALLGDVAAGEQAYHDPSVGCFGCHGEDYKGSGDHGEGTPFFSNNFRSRSQQSVLDYMVSSNHTGQNYATGATAKQRLDISALAKALSGTPGYRLTTPDGSNADIKTYTNVSLVIVNPNLARTKYQVLMVRNLSTGNPDDVKFIADPSKTYPFGLAVMDNDGKNHIGNAFQKLTFKAKS